MGQVKRKKDFVVIGLGRFGTSIIQSLIEYGQTVSAFDIDPEKVEKIADKVQFAAVCDTTDEDQLRSAGIHNADHVIVAIGNDPQASIMTVALLTELNIPYITVKSNIERLSTIYKKLGVTDIVCPERDSGHSTARRVCHDSNYLQDFIGLGSSHAIVQYVIRKNELLNRSLQDLNFRTKFNLNIIAIKRNMEILIPTKDDIIEFNDVIIFVGTEQALADFEDYLNN